MLLGFIRDNYEEEDIVASFSDMSALSQKSLLERAFSIRPQFHRGSTILLKCTDQKSAFIGLTSLWGYCEKVVLIPYDSDDYQVKNIQDKFPEAELVYSNKLLECTPVDSYSKNEVSIDTKVIVATSGTTGIPKLLEHSLASLTSTSNKRKTGSRFVWGLIYRCDRMAGLQVILQALLSGNRIAFASGEYNVSDDVEFMISQDVNSFSATPTYWRKLLMTNGHAKIPLENITLGGEIARQSTINALKASYPDAKIRHIYASTEAGVGFVVSDEQEGFPASFLGKSGTNMFQLDVSDESELMIKKSIPEQNYVSENELFHNGYILTGDIVTQVGDRVFFSGRKSGVINIGGAKVSPEYIESAITSIPDVLEVVVYQKDSSMMGGLIAAEVVLKDNSTQTKKDILRQCKSMLKSHEVPSILKLVDELELTATGKLKRKK